MSCVSTLEAAGSLAITATASLTYVSRTQILNSSQFALGALTGIASGTFLSVADDGG